jgi:hypothetical protein
MTATLIAALVALAACGDGESGATTTAAPFPGVPADAVVVSGSAACEVSDDRRTPEGGPGYLAVCELDLSDPRVSSTERHDRFHFTTDRGGGTVWLAEDATITNADGTWRGSVQSAEGAHAIPAGEAYDVGDGAYGPRVPLLHLPSRDLLPGQGARLDLGRGMSPEHEGVTP